MWLIDPSRVRATTTSGSLTSREVGHVVARRDRYEEAARAFDHGEVRPRSCVMHARPARPARSPGLHSSQPMAGAAGSGARPADHVERPPPVPAAARRAAASRGPPAPTPVSSGLRTPTDRPGGRAKPAARSRRPRRFADPASGARTKKPGLGPSDRAVWSGLWRLRFHARRNLTGRAVFGHAGVAGSASGSSAGRVGERVELRVRMARHRRDAQARGALGHRRVADALRVEAAREQALADAPSSRALSPITTGTMWVALGARRDAVRREPRRAGALRSPASRSRRHGSRAHELERGARSRDLRRRERAAEDEACAPRSRAARAARRMPATNAPN